MVNQVSSVFLFLLVGFIKTNYATENSSCVTPNGEQGSCVPLSSCTILAEALSSHDFDAILFTQKSECGYENGPLVCCGSVAQQNVPDLSSRFYDPYEREEEEKPVILDEIVSKHLPDRSICGIQNEPNQNLGRTFADINDFPWTVGLEYKSKFQNESVGIKCGGALISKRYIVTAAHCLDNNEFELSRAWLGDWKLSSDPDCNNQICNDRVQKIRIGRKMAHGFYRNGLNDIALLRLEHDVLFSDYIRPICLTPANMPHPKPGSRLTVTGWSGRSPWQRSAVSDSKVKLEVPVISNDECQSRARTRTIAPGHLCVGGEFGKDACSTDSGGPLMRKYTDARTNVAQWYLEGIISWGNECARFGSPSVYTRGISYIYWILYTILQEEVVYNYDIEGARRSVLPQRTTCGLQNRVNGRINQDVDITDINEFPWVVRLEYGTQESNKEFTCGGSLITNQYVLTAASCVKNIQYEFMRVWLGDWRQSTDPDCVNGQCNDPVLKLRISKPIMFPYNTNFGINDVALLRLERKIEFNEFIRPICLPPANLQDLPNDSPVIVSGWGAARDFKDISDYKIKLNKKLVSSNECVELYKEEFKGRVEYLGYNTMCVGGIGNKQMCRTGGGIPLVTTYDDRQTAERQWFQVGMNSRGLGCGEQQEPTVYLKLRRFVNWIVRTIAEEG